MERSRIKQANQLKKNLLLNYRSEKNFHVFYYLYDGLDYAGRLSEFHLDPALRQRHNFLTSDSNDILSRQVCMVNIVSSSVL